jgi:predicted permease
MTLLRLFVDHLLPVFLAAGAGYALAATVRPDPRALSHVAFYLFAPCLVYQIIIDSEDSAMSLLRMMGFAIVSLALLAAVTALIVRRLRWPRPLASAVILTAILPNAGNFGLSANLLAFGPEGMAQAGLYFLGSSLITFTLGVLIASLGRASLGAALTGLVRVPVLWAVAFAFVMGGLGWALPGPVARTVELLAQACIPCFLVILGIQLRESRVRGPIKPLLLASGTRLLGAPALALMMVPLFGLEGAARQVAVLQSSMPTAVISIILASEYDIEPGFVTSVVLLTTLLSPLTLTPLLAYLKG